MMNEATRNYVRQHADDDVRMLALRGCKDMDVDLTLALQQIQGRRQARRKLPSWAANDAILYPPHLNMEQCSSETTARYKAALCRRLLMPAQLPPAVPSVAAEPQPSRLLDLTGGFGVDFAFMQDAFSEATYVERDPQLCAISSQNSQALGLHVTTVNADAADHLARLTKRQSLIYLDPARRDVHGGRTYGIADCTPDILQLLPRLLKAAEHVLLKLSPMLDWHKAVSDLGPQHVAEVHIVSVQNECRELLILLRQNCDETALFCVNDDALFRLDDIRDTAWPATPLCSVQPADYLYEPNASLMKAGCFGALAARYGLGQLAPDSHLFASSQPVADFPGRAFVVRAVSTMNKRDLRQALHGIERANIATRNFPLSVAELRRRLKLSEGGDTYIFATTLPADNHVLLICSKG